MIQRSDVWTFCAIDAETKLMPSFKVGNRDHATANAFVGDVATRLKNRPQISSDGMRAYTEAVENAFGMNVDFGMIIKSYGVDKFVLSEPLDHPEVVALAVTLSFQDYEHELNRLLPNERRELIQDLWFKLLEFDIEFRPLGEPPDSVMIGIHIYADELKRGPFWRAVQTIKRAVWSLQWTLQRKFIDPAATNAVN